MWDTMGFDRKLFILTLVFSRIPFGQKNPWNTRCKVSQYFDLIPEKSTNFL